jgi:hypothetical protein
MTGQADPTALTDDEFIEQFENLELAPEAFDHLGHLRLGWLYLQRHSLDGAVERTTRGIRAYAESLGSSEKYRHTLTEATVRIMARRMAQGQYVTLQDLLGENPDLQHDLWGLLTTHYSPELLMSETARRVFVPPDRKPL